MGVQLFFLVSAYTLYLSWVNRCKEPKRIAKFYIRRYFRIAPLYYTGIICYFLLATIRHYTRTGALEWPEQFHFLSLFSNLLLAHGFYPPGNNNVVPGGWSIATEFLFYSIFPYLILILMNKGIRVWLICVSSFIVLLLLSHSTFATMGFQMAIGDFWYHCIINQLPIFLMGITVAHVHAKYLEKMHWVCDALLALLFLCISFKIWNSSLSVMMSVLPMVTGISLAFFLFFVSRIKDQYYTDFLWLICWIGKISFSMYLWHFIIIDLLKVVVPKLFFDYREISLLGLYFVTVIITAIVSYFSEKFIESKGIMFGKKIIDKVFA